MNYSRTLSCGNGVCQTFIQVATPDVGRCCQRRLDGHRCRPSQAQARHRLEMSWKAALTGLLTREFSSA